VFTREAVLLIHERARGIPRTVSVIADNALLTAFALRVKPINSQVINEVCADLDLSTPATAVMAAVPGTAATFDATDSAEKESPAAKAPVLTFDGARDDAEPAAVTLAPAHVSPTASDDEKETSGAGMFTQMYPKRRRFSLFKGQ
jgi:hypothetical protein